MSDEELNKMLRSVRSSLYALETSIEIIGADFRSTHARMEDRLAKVKLNCQALEYELQKESTFE